MKKIRSKVQNMQIDSICLTEQKPRYYLLSIIKKKKGL